MESAGAAGGPIRVGSESGRGAAEYGSRGAVEHGNRGAAEYGSRGAAEHGRRGRVRDDRATAGTQAAATRDGAVEEWIRLHGAAVLRLAYASLMNRAQAEDVFQEVFIRAYRHADRLQDPERVRPWLLQVTMNACRDLRRSWWWRRTRDGSVLDGLAAGEDSEADPAASAVTADVRQALARAVRSLPDGFRETVVLHYFEGLDAPEIARITGVRVGTVHSRLHRARQILRQQLEEWGVEP